MSIVLSGRPAQTAHLIRRMLALTGALCALLPSVVLADCPDGARDATAQEKESALRILAALRDAFPVPAGWRVTKDTTPAAPGSFCKGTTVLRLSFDRAITRVDGMSERRAAYDRRLTDAKRLTPDEQQQVAEVDREINDMARQMGVPRSALKNRSLDKDARAQLEAELRRLGDGMRTVHQRRQALANPWLKDGARKQSYEDALREATREFCKPSEIVVKVAMNDVFAPMKDAARIEIPGATVAYPLHDRDVMVTACGRICMHSKRINISTVLAGQRVGIKEVDEGIWIVSFMHYDLGYIDLEQQTLQPLDNPFDSRLLPMS